MSAKTAIEIGLNAVIVAVTDEEPRLLAVHRSDDPAAASELALPSGPLDPAQDRTLELALSGWVRGQTGVELGYVEQLYTFGNRYRDPRERLGGPRGIAIAYLAVFTTAGTTFLVQFAVLRLPAAKVLAYNYLTPSFVIVYEGLLGHGWTTASVAAGALVTMAALLLLALSPDS